MADEKKPSDKPAAPSAPAGDPFVEIVWWILALWLGLYLLDSIAGVILAIIHGTMTDEYPWLYSTYGFFLSNLSEFFTFLKVAAALLSIGCVAGIFYFYRRVKEVRTDERKLLYPEIAKEEEEYVLNPQWARIISHTEGLNENDWRLAILEADIMLGDLLENMHLPGDTIGDKLKAVERSDFITIDNAWEAHKIRNQIAHEGASYMMNQKEAKRVIGLYRSVFEEFQMV